MVPLKLGYRGVWGVRSVKGSMRVRGYGECCGGREVPPHGTILTKFVLLCGKSKKSLKHPSIAKLFIKLRNSYFMKGLGA